MRLPYRQNLQNESGRLAMKGIYGVAEKVQQVRNE
jgi:hypothetical protein